MMNTGERGSQPGQTVDPLDDLKLHSTSVQATTNTWRRFRAIATSRGFTYSGVLGNLVERWVAEQDGPKREERR